MRAPNHLPFASSSAAASVSASSKAEGAAGAGAGAAGNAPEPGPIAIVTDDKNYATWAPSFADAIRAHVPHDARILTDISVAQLASRTVQERIVGVVWLSFSPAGLGEALEVEGGGIKWVQLPSAGIEKHAAVIRAHPEIIWTTAKGAFAEPVAEHGLALTLSLLRFVPARVVATTWGPPAGNSLFRSNVVILGAGGISLAYLALLAPFHCTAQLVRRNPRDTLDLPPHVDPERVSVHAFSELDALLPQADVLFLACALTDETRHLLNARTLALLAPHCVVVNVGRGGLVQTDALVAAVREGRVGGAGLDVTDPEPLPEGHALFSSLALSEDGAARAVSAAAPGDQLAVQRETELSKTRANVIITPHTADTPEMVRPLLTARAARNAAVLYERSGRFEGVIRIDGEHVY
ncbi:hypothetical protein OC842_001797 [Tilletia horrida]|uniref:D-isomer specific 2-hydroxyacid dehydrogenase NAD-binding domain-containing protein n=1 Tax=Tilletia horrida TaxID=155126 RepID=A0AAN6JLN7_9BASI|nr:hypothetical protein OC842_001797 [Tilletia horrida]